MEIILPTENVDNFVNNNVFTRRNTDKTGPKNTLRNYCTHIKNTFINNMIERWKR